MNFESLAKFTDFWIIIAPIVKACIGGRLLFKAGLCLNENMVLSTYRLIHKKLHWSKNTLLINNPQFPSDFAGILVILSTHELTILTKFD